MTTIAYRDGVLAADTRAYSGSSTPIGSKQKIFKIKNGSAFGVSTTQPGLAEAIRDWFIEDQHFDHEPQINPESGFQILEITQGGEVYYYCNSFRPSGPLSADYFAIGSGAEYALGAMSVGATAVGAIGAAAEHDAWTNATYQAITLFAEEMTDAAE